MTLMTTRRRFLAISAAAYSFGGRAFATEAPEAHWRGTALGAAASIRIVGMAPEDAASVLVAVENELRRLEGIFSLYRTDSALIRLNSTGRLTAPPADLLEVLSLADALHRASARAFDPTVQALFATYAQAASAGRVPDAEEIAAARKLVGWDAVSFGSDAVTLARKGSALTLNGIAQGWITDRIADLLRRHGLTDVLVDAGEIVALGLRSDGKRWTAGVATPEGRVIHRLTLTDRALATSAPKGTVLDANGRLGHIFDPVLGTEARAANVVSVSAMRAAVADGLSTALCAVPAEKRDQVVAAFPGAQLEIAV